MFQWFPCFFLGIPGQKMLQCNVPRGFKSILRESSLQPSQIYQSYSRKQVFFDGHCLCSAEASMCAMFPMVSRIYIYMPQALSEALLVSNMFCVFMEGCKTLEILMFSAWRIRLDKHGQTTPVFSFPRCVLKIARQIFQKSLKCVAARREQNRGGEATYPLHKATVVVDT